MHADSLRSWGSRCLAGQPESALIDRPVATALWVLYRLPALSRSRQEAARRACWRSAQLSWGWARRRRWSCRSSKRSPSPTGRLGATSPRWSSGRDCRRSFPSSGGDRIALQRLGPPELRRADHLHRRGPPCLDGGGTARARRPRRGGRCRRFAVAAIADPRPASAGSRSARSSARRDAGALPSAGGSALRGRGAPDAGACSRPRSRPRATSRPARPSPSSGSHGPGDKSARSRSCVATASGEVILAQPLTSRSREGAPSSCASPARPSGRTRSAAVPVALGFYVLVGGLAACSYRRAAGTTPWASSPPALYVGGVADWPGLIVALDTDAEAEHLRVLACPRRCCSSRSRRRCAAMRSVSAPSGAVRPRRRHDGPGSTRRMSGHQSS